MPYDSATAADTDREQQKTLLQALGAWDRALRRDGCSAWCITGNTGTIHTFGDGASWILYVACRSIRHWTATKARLSFCSVVQDADGEGCLRLSSLPTPDQAAIIRDVLGIQKRREVSPAVLERLKAFAFEQKTRSEASLARKIGNCELPRPNTHLGAIADNSPPVARVCDTDEQGVR